jgi:trk system potassium uptake protein TrkH
LPTDNINKIIETNLQKIIFIFSLLISMLNVYLLFNIFNKKTLLKDHKEDVYLIVLTIILFILIYFNNYKGLDIIISVVSSLANSGLSLVETDNNLSLYFLLITMVGGSLISNTSGIKLTRFYILLKITSAEIIKLVSPNSVINKTIYNTDQKISDENVKISFLVFISFFLSLLILSSFLVIDNIGFEKSFKLSILALTNTVNSEMYNMQNLNFSNLLTSSKISLILFMIIGKIELVSIFLIFKKILFKE